ncbi:trigger factor [bacterium]|nr:trigger factor [bacterium]
MSSLENLDGLMKKITIEVPKDTVNEEFSKAYGQVKQTANIKGFRQGKAPLAKIKSLYSEKVKDQVLEKLVSKYYAEALQEHKVSPIEYPKIDISSFDEDKPLSFTAEIEVRPTIELKNYEGLEIPKQEKKVVDEKRLEEVFQNIAKNFQETAPVLEDRPAQDKDLAKIDFDGFVDGEPLAGGSAKDHELELGSNSFIEGFEAGIIGMKIGDEKELNLKFPDEYQEPSIAGKPVLFKVKLNGLSQIKEPVFDDEFAKKVGGPDTKSLEDLKAKITEDLEASDKQQDDEKRKDDILQALVKANPVEVPKSLFKQQKEKIIADVRGKMSQQGLTDLQFEEYKQKWDSDFNETSNFMIQSSFLINELSIKLKLEAGEKEFQAKLDEYQKSTGIDMPKLVEFYGNPDRRSQLLYKITEEAVIKHLLDNAKEK